MSRNTKSQQDKDEEFLRKVDSLGNPEMVEPLSLWFNKTKTISYPLSEDDRNSLDKLWKQSNQDLKSNLTLDAGICKDVRFFFKRIQNKDDIAIAQKRIDEIIQDRDQDIGIKEKQEKELSKHNQTLYSLSVDNTVSKELNNLLVKQAKAGFSQKVVESQYLQDSKSSKFVYTKQDERKTDKIGKIQTKSKKIFRDAQKEFCPENYSPTIIERATNAISDFTKSVKSVLSDVKSMFLGMSKIGSIFTGKASEEVQPVALEKESAVDTKFQEKLVSYMVALDNPVEALDKDNPDMTIPKGLESDLILKNSGISEKVIQNMYSKWLDGLYDGNTDPQVMTGLAFGHGIRYQPTDKVLDALGKRFKLEYEMSDEVRSEIENIKSKYNLELNDSEILNLLNEANQVVTKEKLQEDVREIAADMLQSSESEMTRNPGASAIEADREVRGPGDKESFADRVSARRDSRSQGQSKGRG